MAITEKLTEKQEMIPWFHDFYLWHDEKALIGTSRFIELGEGISIWKNHIRGFSSMQKKTKKMSPLLVFNYCHRGQFVSQFSHRLFYLQRGMSSLHCNMSPYAKEYRSFYPSSYYDGFTVVVSLTEALYSTFLQKTLEVNLWLWIKQYTLLEQPILFPDDHPIHLVAPRLYENLSMVHKPTLRVYIGELLVLLDKHLQTHFFQTKKYVNPLLKEAAEKASHYLSHNLDESLPLQVLADRLGVSLTSLKEAFVLLYDEPMATYRRRIRLYTASLYLMETDLSIQEIAKKVGFKNPFKFSSAFKNYFGKTPTDFRKNEHSKAFFSVLY